MRKKYKTQINIANKIRGIQIENYKTKRIPNIEMTHRSVITNNEIFGLDQRFFFSLKFIYIAKQGLESLQSNE